MLLSQTYLQTVLMMLSPVGDIHLEQPEENYSWLLPMIISRLFVGIIINSYSTYWLTV